MLPLEPITPRAPRDVVDPPVARAAALAYATRAAEAFSAQSVQAGALARWARAHARGFRIAMPPRITTDLPDDDQDDEHTVGPALWQATRAALTAAAKRGPAADPFRARMQRVARLVGLDDADRAVLLLFGHYAASPPVERLWDLLSASVNQGGCLTVTPGLIAALTGLSRAQTTRCLAADGALRQSGLIRVDTQGNIALLPQLVQLLAGHDGDDVAALLLGSTRAAELRLSDFAHIGADVAHASALLAGALAARRPGTHVLLYGPAGTGKTELARALAAACRARLHELGEADADGAEPDRGDRLGALRLAQRVLSRGKRAGRALLLMDEAEDLFDAAPAFAPFGQPPSGSRVHLHRLLEAAPVPVLWTANALGRFGAPVLRRMTFALEVRLPPRSARAALWGALARKHGVVLPASDCAALAAALAAAPGVAETAMAAARLVGGGTESVRRGAFAIVRALGDGGAALPVSAQLPCFDTALLAADTDLVALADQLAAAPALPACGILLAGPPGSGKSAFARHLADRLGLDPLLLRGSELLAPYVGETEARIAENFRAAAEGRQLLILDEADGFLADRREAVRNWEVTQVNELLTWMEAHPLPFVFTTNLEARLDPAAARRFLFRVHFGFLDTTQLEAAWRRFLPGAAPEALALLDRLTPADFAQVAARARLLGSAFGSQAMLDALRATAAAKLGAPRAIGFART